MVLKSEYSLGREYPNKDLPTLLYECMLQHDDKIYLVDSVSGRQYSYRETYECCRKIGQSLHNTHSLRKGDVILMFSANCPEYTFCTIAAASIGLTVSFINPLYTEAEISYYVEDCGAKVIITSATEASKIKKVAQKFNRVQDVIVFGEAPGCISYTSLVDNDGSNFPKMSLDQKNDVIFMPYSSGTTGRPKGVMLTSWSSTHNALQLIAPDIGLFTSESQEVVVSFVPLYHIYGLGMTIITALSGHTLVLIPKYDLVGYLHTVKKYKATVLPLVPPNVVQFVKTPWVTASDFDTVRAFLCGAAPLGPDLEREFNQKFPIQLKLPGYGATETSGALTALSKNLRSPIGSVGKALPMTELRFVDPESGKDVGANTNAEIWARGPQIMKGYQNRPEETRECLDDDGWFRTGDIGRYDSDGFVYIVDRIKELIKYKGLQVAPADLENVLLTHTSVADCAVVGVPDLEAGEIPRAYVVLKPNHKASAKDISDFIEGQVAPHKKLRGGVRFVNAVPKSPSGKILRKILKEEIMAELKLSSKL